jgi:hypothetical protein
MSNHLSMMQHLKNVILIIKIICCNIREKYTNPNIRTLFLQYMNHLIVAFKNHLLQHPEIPLQHEETKTYKNNKGIGSRCMLLQPLGNGHSLLLA